MDLSIDDPYYALNECQYNDRIEAAKKEIKRAKKKSTILDFDKIAFRQAPYSEQKILDSIFRFEFRMLNLKHSVCSNCFETRIDMKTTIKTSICTRCQRKSERDAYNSENIMLPTWIDDNGQIQHHIPPELENLTVAEVLLIQRVAPLVPLVHIRNGTLGLRGHVCSFMQEVNDVATRLPRLPTEVKAVKMIRSFKDKDGIDQVKVFIVNKYRVIRALNWLIKYHRDYQQAFETGELTIDESTMDWMNGEEEAELPSITLAKSDSTSSEEANIGVSKTQVADPDEQNDEYETSGISCSGNAALSSDASDAALTTLKEEATKENVKIPALDWPQQSTEAISEYDCSVRIFVNAFPHLFPGGIADIREGDRKVNVATSKWAKHMLLYVDGRFVRDHVFCFFAHNYSLRQRNIEAGSYFVNTLINDPPRSLEDLQASLRRGDSSFVNKMVYYVKRIRGSDAYWRYKRAELYNWIHYHIGEGHGAPNGFFTLSCAEYFWPDMIRLLEDRIWIAEGRHRNGPGAKTDRHGNIIDLSNDRKARNKAINDYSVVVQEFFIRRTEDYLNTVGRDVLGIKHYWCRFEFAKGRGQIHAHILVILAKDSQNRIQEQVNAANGNREKEAKLVAEWAKKQFGMTAEYTEPSASVDNDRCVFSQSWTCHELGIFPLIESLSFPHLCSVDRAASSIRLADVRDYRRDEANLCDECMMHTCSSYCMRHPKGKKNRCRMCRAGAGEEKTKGMSDTPGFPLREKPAIEFDNRGFYKLHMRRNHLRMVQTPLHILRGWRGNCDFTILLYASPDGKPNAEEISRTTDYIVSYQCKGNETSKVERTVLRDYILE